MERVKVSKHRKTNRRRKSAAVSGHISLGGNIVGESAVRRPYPALNGIASEEAAMAEFIQATALGKISEKLDKDRLNGAVSGQCLQNFNNDQLMRFYGYLAMLKAARFIYGKTPSEVQRAGEIYHN